MTHLNLGPSQTHAQTRKCWTFLLLNSRPLDCPTITKLPWRVPDSRYEILKAVTSCMACSRKWTLPSLMAGWRATAGHAAGWRSPCGARVFLFCRHCLREETLPLCCQGGISISHWLFHAILSSRANASTRTSARNAFLSLLITIWDLFGFRTGAAGSRFCSRRKMTCFWTGMTDPIFVPGSLWGGKIKKYQFTSTAK